MLFFATSCLLQVLIEVIQKFPQALRNSDLKASLPANRFPLPAAGAPVTGHRQRLDGIASGAVEASKETQCP